MEPQPIWLSVLITVLHGGGGLIVLCMLIGELADWLRWRSHETGRCPVNDVPAPRGVEAQFEARKAAYRRELERELAERCTRRAG